MQPVVLISFLTNHLYFTPNYIKLSMRIRYIHKMPFDEGLSLLNWVFRSNVHLQKPQHSNIMNSSVCSYCNYNSQLLGERTETCPLAGNICGRHEEHTHTSSEENAVLSTLLFYFHLIIISLLTGTSLPPECKLLLKVKGPLTHHHSSCIYSHIWAMKEHSENWEAGWSKKPSLPGCLWWDQQKQPHHSEELP